MIRLNKAFARKRCTQDRINFAEQNFAEIDGKTVKCEKCFKTVESIYIIYPFPPAQQLLFKGKSE